VRQAALGRFDGNTQGRVSVPAYSCQCDVLLELKGESGLFSGKHDTTREVAEDKQRQDKQCQRDSSA
jgi:hypothetical protein